MKPSKDKPFLNQLMADLARAVTEVSPHDAPVFLGHLEQLKATLWIRILGALPSDGQGQGADGDTLIDVTEAARRLSLSEDYLYRHHKRLPFTVRIGKRILFSSKGIERYIRQRQGR